MKELSRIPKRWAATARREVKTLAGWGQRKKDSALKASKGLLDRASITLPRHIASAWLHGYRVRYAFDVWRLRRGAWAGLALLAMLLAVSVPFSGTLQAAFEAHYSSVEGRRTAVEALRALLLNLGGPLIGAVAILASLVLFALQVNVERMPHRLFRRFSSDPLIMGAFAGAFALAVAVSAESVWVSEQTFALAVLFALWAVVVTLLAFLIAYRRALTLISPMSQLGIVAADAERELGAAAAQAKRVRPLMAHLQPKQESGPFEATHDTVLTVFYARNAQWTAGAIRAINHAFTFARRYAERGDYEISGAALNVVVRVHHAYIEAKGKTFYANQLIGDSSLSTDGLINISLEHLRQLVQVALARGDEQQLEQALRAFASLAQLYTDIDYSTPFGSKTHAMLAAGYLAEAVDSIVPHKKTDLLMIGLRLLGQVALTLAIKDRSENVVNIAERIAQTAAMGLAGESPHAVTDIGVAQLANLTFALLRKSSDDIGFAIGKVREALGLVTKAYLHHVKEAPLTLSSPLGAYYSSLHGESFVQRMVALANLLGHRKADDQDAEWALRNLELWSDDLPESTKEVLLSAVAKRSRLTQDVIDWIGHIVNVLMVAALSPACDERQAESLRENARNLVYVLTWLPSDRDSIRYVENFMLTRSLFEMGVAAHRFGCPEVLEAILRRVLLGWTFASGAVDSSRGILDRGLVALATLALLSGDSHVEVLRLDARKRIAETALDDEQKVRTAQALVEAAQKAGHSEFETDPVKRVAHTLDAAKRVALLGELVRMLLPPGSESA